MNANLKEAIRLLGIYTTNRFDIWLLAGQPKASCRAHVMGALLGRKATQRESGVTMLRDKFYAVLALSGSCLAERDRMFSAICHHATCLCRCGGHLDYPVTLQAGDPCGSDGVCLVCGAHYPLLAAV